MFSLVKRGRLENVKFIYTRHVRVRIRQRGLSTKQIETVVSSPDRVVPSFRGRVLAQKTFGTSTLEVAYRTLNDHVVIITAYWLEEGG